ncbi:hypothetical protein KVR01_004773 [Diaporthe batatas]|uniref:uncharacterized protein n=1 Tax=Diaporthe batatas TaxID=748121 RepID=UPI001D040DF4|nr:uncharacterized protein KVR01_004773 [Diaporthe batatas]KAG8166221.1 hypothetical protein KVR01_004773 [Diaporthe batatas]
MSRTKDIRAYCGPGRPLMLRWPSAPEGVDDAKSSGLICATVVARAMWSRIKPQFWPEQRDDEDAITTYTFADFKDGLPWLAESLQEIWEKAKESTQQGGQVDDSFAGICRSPRFVRAFWANPLFRLTTDHYRVGWQYDEPHVVLGGDDLARQALVAWDGVEPETLAQAINNLTFKKEDDRRNIISAFFSNPSLLQVDLTPGNGSDKSLADIQTFEADRWAFVPNSHSPCGKWKVTGQVHYSLMAVVLHRENEDGVDSVRTFRENGQEELLEGVCEIAWPFDLDEPVPAGRKVTVFYNSALPSGKVYPLTPSKRFPALPMELNADIKAQVWGSVEAEGGEAAEDELELADLFIAGLSQWKSVRDEPAAGSDRHGPQSASADMQGHGEREARPSGRSQTDPAPGKASSPRRTARRNQQPNAWSNAQSNAPLGAPTGPRAQRPPRGPREEASGPNALPIPADRQRLGDGQVGNSVASRGGRDRGGRGRGGRGGR